MMRFSEATEGLASVLQGPGGVLQTPYLGGLRESLFDTACIIDVK